MLRMSLQQAHIVLNNGLADLTILFTNRLSEFIILFIKVSTNLRKSLPKDGMFRFANISEALLYFGSLGKIIIISNSEIIIACIY